MKQASLLQVYDSWAYLGKVVVDRGAAVTQRESDKKYMKETKILRVRFPAMAT